MIFHPNFGIVAILASFFVVHLGRWVAADNFVCDVSLEFSTWEDKSIPQEYQPVPDIKLLKYGISHIVMERFDLNAGVGNWMTSQKFKSFQLKDGEPEDDDDVENLHEDFSLAEDDFEEDAEEDVEDASDNSHRNLRRNKKKKKRMKKKKKVMIEPTDSQEQEQDYWNRPIKDYFNPTDDRVNYPIPLSPQCYRDPDCFAQYQEESAELLDGKPTNKMHPVALWQHLQTLDLDDDYLKRPDSRNLQTGSMPWECMRVKKCRHEFMKRKSMRSRMRAAVWIGYCNLCDDDDDHGESDVHRRARKRAAAKKEAERRKKKKGPKIRLSLDQLVAGTFEDVGGSIETHLAFEDDVCAELAGLQREYAPLRTIQDCNIEFHCQRGLAEEFGEEDDEDLVIVDNRGGEVETNEDNGFLSYVTNWSMQQGKDEHNSSPILYSITAADDVATES